MQVGWKYSKDPFRPYRESARSIYDAFQAEAANRKGRSIEEWMEAERQAVYREAMHQAGILGLRAPSIEEVVRAECCAAGSVDYGAKWAYGVVEAMLMS